MALVFDTLMESIPNYPISGNLFAVIYIAEAIIFFFPMYYLHKFSTLIKSALKDVNESQITGAFQYLRAHYRFIGIMTIIFLALFVLSMVIGLFAGVVGAFLM
jgi:hypothetical protein